MHPASDSIYIVAKLFNSKQYQYNIFIITHSHTCTESVTTSCIKQNVLEQRLQTVKARRTTRAQPRHSSIKPS